MNFEEIQKIRARNLPKVEKTKIYIDIRYKPDNPQESKDEELIYETAEERARRKSNPNRERNQNSGFHQAIRRIIREPGEDG